MTDFAALMRKYMALVVSEESISFLDRVYPDGTSLMYEGPPFTAEEMKILRDTESSLEIGRSWRSD
jgi:hypothetical protein